MKFQDLIEITKVGQQLSGKIFNYPSFSNKCEKFFFSIRFDTFFEFLGLKSSSSMCDLQPTISIKLRLHPHFCPQLETLKLLSPFNINSNDVHLHLYLNKQILDNLAKLICLKNYTFL